MKQIINICIIIFSIASFAQQGINYKAILKDSNGSVMANTSIDVEFYILQGVAQTVVYEESHTTTTDANGIFIVNIGEGSPEGGSLFNAIDWASDEHYLNVQIDDGNNLTDFGTTSFQKVPYAIQADKAALAENVSGLEVIIENSVSGWRLIGKEPGNYGNIGANAIDLSTSSTSSTENGATGNTAIASGFNTQASGAYATAFGFTTEATQTASTALGDKSIATGNSSLAFGNQTEASGFASVAGGTSSTATGNSAVALGYNLDADAFRSAAFGSYNTGGGNPDSWQATDPIFQVGNGQSINNKSDALTILKDGTITAPSFDVSEIVDDKALITKEYFDTNQPTVPDASSGLELITENDGTQDNTGWRLKNVEEDNYGPIGESAVDLSLNYESSSTRGATGANAYALGLGVEASGNFSIAIGNSTTASGESSIAMGESTIASGTISTAKGTSTTASGFVSTAMGSNTTAFGDYSTALGNNTAAVGSYSTAMGLNTYADTYASTVIGRYNIGEGNPISWVNTDPLFEVGNGTGSSNRSNALTILKNGQHIIKSNTFGGLRIESGSGLNDDGIRVLSPSRTGIVISDPGSNGVLIDTPDNHGFLVLNSGRNGLVIDSPNESGIEIKEANIEGVKITNSNGNGIFIDDSANDGINIENSSADGIDIKNSGDIGIEVTDSGTYGSFFEGNVAGTYTRASNDNNPDVILGGRSNSTTGDNGIIASDPIYDSSDILLRSNDAVVIQLDVDTNETGEFQVRNGLSSVVFEVEDSGNATLTGSLTQNSDRRLKKDIADLPYGLKEILQLEPKAYNWKDKPQNKKSLGLIAQDVQSIISNIVNEQDDEAKTLGISYTELIPVLINAIKEQQKIIESQKLDLKAEKKINKKQSEQFEALLKRVKVIESRQYN